MHSRGMVVLAPWIDQSTLLHKESAITTVFREVHGERAAPWLFNILDQHRGPGPAPWVLKKREHQRLAVNMRARYSEYPPSPPHPPHGGISFGKTKIKKGRGCNFVRTLYSYWHLHGCRGVVPDKTPRIPCSRPCRILFTTENTRTFPPKKASTNHHFPCSFERRWSEWTIAVFLFVIAVCHNLTSTPAPMYMSGEACQTVT